MNAVETAGLVKTYGSKSVVSGIDLIVPAGACMALVGGNGAGKSTTLQMLMNLLPISQGTATILGRDARKLRGADFREIGYASESQILPPYLDAEQFFGLLRSLYPHWDAAIEADVRHRLRIPEGRALRKLSRGERMKVCIAAALPFRPRLLVLDEPLSGLDPLSRENVIGLLTEQAEHATILISTHDLSEVEGLATHIAVLDTGRLVLQGEVDAILNRFRSVVVRVEAGAAGLGTSLPHNWLSPAREGVFLSFIHRSEHDEPLETELERVLGPGLRPIVSSLNLAGLVSAAMRGAATDAAKH